MYTILFLGLGAVCEVIGVLLIHKKKEFGIGLCCTGVFIVSDLIFISLSNTTAFSEVVFYFTLAVDLAVALVLSYFLIKISFQKIGETSNRIFETWGLFFIPLVNLFYIFYGIWTLEVAGIGDFSDFFAIIEGEKNNIIVFLLLYGVGTGLIWLGKGVISCGIGGYFCLFGITRGTAVLISIYYFLVSYGGRISWDAVCLIINCTMYLCLGFFVPIAWRVAHERQAVNRRKTSEWKN